MCMYLYIHSTAFGERRDKGPDSSRPGMKPTRGNQMDSSPKGYGYYGPRTKYAKTNFFFDRFFDISFILSFRKPLLIKIEKTL